MPELPEVETVARQLAPRVTGRQVRTLRIYDRRLRGGPTPAVAGRRIVDVRRSGKQVLIEFSPRNAGSGGPLWLAVHLRMTGRLLWLEQSESQERKHMRACFRLDQGQLRFVDTRRFGTFSWYRREQETLPPGVDPLDAKLTAAGLDELIGNSTQAIKAWLLRQDRLVGLGNIYASEILHRSRISPFRAAGSLSPGEVRQLHRATRRILERAIINCGTTFSDFQDVRGVEGSYQSMLAVYGRENRRCRRCRQPILRVVQQQRSTFYCAGCQR